MRCRTLRAAGKGSGSGARLTVVITGDCGWGLVPTGPAPGTVCVVAGGLFVVSSPKNAGRMKKMAPAATMSRRMTPAAKILDRPVLLCPGDSGAEIPAGNPPGVPSRLYEPGDPDRTGDPQFSQNLVPSDNTAPHAVQNFGLIVPLVLSPGCRGFPGDW